MIVGELMFTKSAVSEFIKLVVGEPPPSEFLVSEFAFTKLLVREPALFEAFVREWFTKAPVAEFVSASFSQFSKFLAFASLATFTEGTRAGPESSFSTRLSRCLRLEFPGPLIRT